MEEERLTVTVTLEVINKDGEKTIDLTLVQGAMKLTDVKKTEKALVAALAEVLNA